ncbi:MAG: P-loop NTPase [Firmicutes bacterium]|nr:P-loop NTPase [Bacillota bacterium]
MKVCVASGKGGTGKTTVAVNMAFAVSGLGEPVQLIDCDVEEPNAHLFVKPSWTVRRSAFTPAPQVDESRCTNCDVCSEVCQFHAILVSPNRVFILDELCHSCGACVEMCPEKALKETPRQIGEIEEGIRSRIRFVHGRLTPGEAMSPPLIRQVKRLAWEEGAIILDCPPGTSCPVVESVKGCDFCVLVTEPTPFGLNDLEIALDMLSQVRIPGGVVINRCDLGTGEVSEYCRKAGIPVLMRMPYDEDLARLYARGIPVSTVSREWEECFRMLWDRVASAAGKPSCEPGAGLSGAHNRLGQVTD